MLAKGRVVEKRESSSLKLRKLTFGTQDLYPRTVQKKKSKKEGGVASLIQGEKKGRRLNCRRFNHLWRGGLFIYLVQNTLRATEKASP